MALVRTSKPALAEAVFNVDAGADNLRLECVRMAVERGGTTAEVIATAQALFDFVRPRKTPVDPATMFPDVPAISP